MILHNNTVGRGRLAEAFFNERASDRKNERVGRQSGRDRPTDRPTDGEAVID